MICAKAVHGAAAQGSLNRLGENTAMARPTFGLWLILRSAAMQREYYQNGIRGREI